MAAYGAVAGMPMAMLLSLIPCSAEAQLKEADQIAFVATLRNELPALPNFVRRIQAGEISQERIKTVYDLLANTNEVEIHRMRGQSENVVYVSRDGHKEIVYGRDGKLVENHFNQGSYNYFHPEQDSLRHFTFDIAPWLSQGTNRTDPTSRRERTHAYAADIYMGVQRLHASNYQRHHHSDKTPKEAKSETGDKTDPSSVDLSQRGTIEAVAVILLSIERGGAQEIFHLVKSDQKSLKRDQLMNAVRRFENGLNALWNGD